MFLFYCGDRSYLVISGIYKILILRLLSKILTETRTSDPSFVVDAIMQVSEPNIYMQRSKRKKIIDIMPKT